MKKRWKRRGEEVDEEWRGGEEDTLRRSGEEVEVGTRRNEEEEEKLLKEVELIWIETNLITVLQPKYTCFVRTSALPAIVQFWCVE